jgi:nucleotide-binding universal stress UspA family protein
MKILIGIDGSEQADTALRWGLTEARLRAAAVTVVHAMPAHDTHGGERHRPYAQRIVLAHELLAKAVARAATVDDDMASIETVAVVDDVPARALLERTAECDLVVVGSRGRGGFAGLLLGSVSQQVSAHAPVPVAVIPTDRGEDRRRDPGAIREIVVGVDGSRQSVGALRWALREADLRHCPLTAVYVYPDPAASLTGDVVTGISQMWTRSFTARSHDTAVRELDELLAREAPSAAATVERSAVAGSAAALLVDEAADPATMLVLGNRGRGGFAGLLLGSVTHQCLHHARGPVVVVHHRPGTGS